MEEQYKGQAAEFTEQIAENSGSIRLSVPNTSCTADPGDKRGY
jgi:hypothetical protein